MGMLSPNNDLLSVLEFPAVPNVKVDIEISQIVLLMPILRRVTKAAGDEYIDATGDCDFCMSIDGRYCHIYNRRSTTESFAFRVMAVDYLAKKRGR